MRNLNWFHVVLFTHASGTVTEFMVTGKLFFKEFAWNSGPLHSGAPWTLPITLPPVATPLVAEAWQRGGQREWSYPWAQPPSGCETASANIFMISEQRVECMAELAESQPRVPSQRTVFFLLFWLPACLSISWVDWKWRKWNWRTIKIAGREIDGPSCNAYDTIRDVILTCARKPTWVSLIYQNEMRSYNRRAWICSS